MTTPNDATSTLRELTLSVTTSLRHRAEPAALPHISTHGGPRVDAHFITVGIDREAASKIRTQWRKAVREVFGTNLLDGGASYLDFAALLGDEETALRCMALGQHYQYWQFCIPSDFGLEGDAAEAAAMNGLICIIALKIPLH